MNWLPNEAPGALSYQVAKAVERGTVMFADVKVLFAAGVNWNTPWTTSLEVAKPTTFSWTEDAPRTRETLVMTGGARRITIVAVDPGGVTSTPSAMSETVMVMVPATVPV